MGVEDVDVEIPLNDGLDKAIDILTTKVEIQDKIVSSLYEHIEKNDLS